MTWLGWLACTGISTTDPPSGPPADAGATQVGNDGGTETGAEDCEEAELDPDSILATGERVGDLLAWLVPPTRVAPTWFDGRTAEIAVDVAWVGGPIVLRADCSVEAEIQAELVADDGSIDQAFVAPLALPDRVSPDRVSLDRSVDDEAWTGALAGDAVHGAPCLPGSRWRTSIWYEEASWNGVITHRCVRVASGGGGDTGGGGAPDTGATTDTTGGGGGSTTLTGTTLVQDEETVTVAAWSVP